MDQLNSSFTNITVFGADRTSGDSDTATGESVRLSPALLLFFTVCLALLVTVGLVGNTLVIFALVRTRAHRATTTNAYILNLSIADLLFLIFCVPFQGTVYILNDWPFRQFMCKATHFCQYCTMYASIWILTVMSVDRYMAIGHLLKSVDWRSPGQAMRICCYVWLAAAVLAMPWWILYQTAEVPNRGVTVTACFDYWTDGMYEYRKWLFLIVFLTGFVLPSIIIFCMSLLVARSIKNAVGEPLLIANERRSSNSASSMRRSDAGGGNVISKRRRRVVWLVFGLSLTFFLCWLPQNASFMWLNFHRDIVASVQRHYKIYFIVKVASHMLTYVNSSVNPILYSLASGQFRSRLAQALLVRGAGSFNHRGAISRPRSMAGKRNSAANDAAAPGADFRNAGSIRGASDRWNRKSREPTIYANTTNGGRMDGDVAAYSNRGEYWNQSSKVATNQLLVPGCKPVSPKSSHSPRWSRHQLELSCVSNLKVTGGDSTSVGPSTKLGGADDTKRQRSLTWSTTLTPAGNSFEADSVHCDAQKTAEEGEIPELVITVPHKRRRFFQCGRQH